MSNVTYKYIKQNSDIQTYINHADKALESMGYTEHSGPHAAITAEAAYDILSTLGYSERECELAQIAGYMHDIGNCVNRSNHAQTGAIMALNLLDKLAMPAEEIAVIISAIGNHDEHTATPVNPIAAAVILADKMDVRRSRVRHCGENWDIHDIHDRVNYACVQSRYYFSEDKSELFLDLIIDKEISSIMEYFEIFLQRMSLCRRSAQALGISFRLVMNNSKIV
ncbi:MAG: HD domain-containing protein [Oscillospiraceae bacterium]|nr:HD domain-containing protein [Oscillospiraceae bacterium]